MGVMYKTSTILKSAYNNLFGVNWGNLNFFRSSYRPWKCSSPWFNTNKTY